MKLQPSFYFKPQMLFIFYSILIKKNTKQSRRSELFHEITFLLSPVIYHLQWYISGRRTGKRSVFTPIPKKGDAKKCSNYCTIALISHASKVMLKILQARLQQSVNCELPDVQAGFRKARGMRDKIANIHLIIKKARQFQKKTSISALLTMPKPLTVQITTNCGKFFKRWDYQTTLPAS